MTIRVNILYATESNLEIRGERMRLTEQTSYALRVVTACALRYPQTVKVAELADESGITEFTIFKLLKVATKAGLIQSTRGRGGGIRLAVAPADVSVGQVIRAYEPRFQDCGPVARMLMPAEDLDVIDERVGHMLGRGYAAFLAELDTIPIAFLLEGERAPAAEPQIL